MRDAMDMAFPTPSDSSEPQHTSSVTAWLAAPAGDHEVAEGSPDYLAVRLGPPGPAVRGRLALFIEGALERTLDACHAPAPGVVTTPDLAEVLADQLYRARIMGVSGIHLTFSTFSGIANLAGALDAQDSAVLRWWLEAAKHFPIRLTFPDVDRKLMVYGEPVTLESLLAHDSELEADDDQRLETTDVTNAPATAEVEEDAALSEAARELAEQFSSQGDTSWLRETLLHLSTPPPAISDAAPGDAEPEYPEVEVIADEPEPAGEQFEEAPIAPIVEEAAACEPSEEDASFASEDALEDAACEPIVEEEAPVSSAIVAAPVVDPEIVERCLAWGRELEASAGPKPLSVVEKQFLHAYAPLREVVDFGLAPDESRAVVEQWSSSFAHSYGEAFDALRLRGKRPTMVLDVPDIALRLARLHGARSVQLLLVDGMRFDIGVRIHERLRLLAGGHAACVERVLLWAALPAKTSIQVELIGRGASGLREFTGEVDDETLVARGRKAATIRRLRTGRREVYKLDLVEARLSELGEGGVEAFADLAFEVAERLASHFEGVPDRTLVLVFGDHGFVVERDANGVLTTRQGGASPEEVLVPGYAWLVGAVH